MGDEILSDRGRRRGARAAARRSSGRFDEPGLMGIWVGEGDGGGSVGCCHNWGIFLSDPLLGSGGDAGELALGVAEDGVIIIVVVEDERGGAMVGSTEDVVVVVVSVLQHLELIQQIVLHPEREEDLDLEIIGKETEG